MERLKHYWKEFFEDESGIEHLQLAIVVAVIVILIWGLAGVLKI